MAGMDASSAPSAQFDNITCLSQAVITCLSQPTSLNVQRFPQFIDASIDNGLENGCAVRRPDGALAAWSGRSAWERGAGWLGGLGGLVDSLRRGGLSRGLARVMDAEDAQPFMRGALRRIEGRIGQLLGPTVERQRTDLTVPHEGQSIPKNTRADFRLIARALGDEIELAEDDWRTSRRALVRMIREKLKLEPQ